MTTMGDLVADARRMAFGSMPEQINLIATNASAGATSLVMEMDVSGITTGAMLSSGLNVWFVKGVDTGTKTIQVVPGYGGAPEGAVTAGDIVYVKPRVTDHYLFTTMCDVIRSLSSPSNGLYKRSSWTATVDTQWQTYAIPAEAQGMIGLLGARVLYPSSSDAWFDVPPSAMRVQREANVVKVLRDIAGGTSIEFRYKGPFTVPTTLAQDAVTHVGLADTMLDIPPLGAVVTLLRTTESRRNQIQTQGDSRRAGEVQATSNLSAAAAFARDYKGRVTDEYARLLANEPIIRGV